MTSLTKILEPFSNRTVQHLKSRFMTTWKLQLQSFRLFIHFRKTRNDTFIVEPCLKMCFKTVSQKNRLYTIQKSSIATNSRMDWFFCFVEVIVCP